MHRFEERFLAADVQVGVLLSGETRLGEVLGRGRGADGDPLSAGVAQPAISLEDFLGERFVHRAAAQQPADLCRDGLDHRRVAILDRRGELGDLCAEPVRADEAEVGPRGDDEARRDREFCPRQLAQVDGLATHFGQRGQAAGVATRSTGCHDAEETDVGRVGVHREASFALAQTRPFLAVAK